MQHRLEVKAEKIHAIMGLDGPGKSTLAHALAGRTGCEVSAGEREVVFRGGRRRV
jgi:Fe-S cluster assembly ATP-binding protein